MFNHEVTGIFTGDMACAGNSIPSAPVNSSLIITFGPNARDTTLHTLGLV